MFRVFFAMCKFVRKEQYLDIVLPRFVINIAGPMFNEIKLYIDEKYYGQNDFKYPIDALHIYGEQDPFIDAIEPTVDFYTHNNTVVLHEKSHMVPRTFTDENFDKISKFFKHQYIVKNLNDEGYYIE